MAMRIGVEPTWNRIDASTSRSSFVTLSRMQSGDFTTAPRGTRLSSIRATSSSKSRQSGICRGPLLRLVGFREPLRGFFTNSVSPVYSAEVLILLPQQLDGERLLFVR